MAPTGAAGVRVLPWAHAEAAGVQAGDVVLTAVVAFTLSILATLYPSYRASQVNPVEALRYE